jgi:hypothetical protein
MIHDDFAWFVAESANKDNPFFIRFAEVKDKIRRASFPHRLNVFWELRAPEPSGLPSKQDSEETQVFEERLIEAMEKEGRSILVMVLTGRGQKEYVIQTTDPQLFLESITNMPQEEERYPVEIIHNEDDTWDYYERVLSDIQKK